eukprot:8291584-Lingulodinium_polyedra.AAC.1
MNRRLSNCPQFTTSWGPGRRRTCASRFFGPHGRRLQRRLVRTVYTFTFQTGGWRRQELPGPPDFAAWWKSWMALRTTLLLLRA